MSTGRSFAALTLVVVALGPVSPEAHSPTAEPPAGARILVPAHREEQAPGGVPVRRPREVSPANPFILPSTATTIPGFELPGETAALDDPASTR